MRRTGPPWILRWIRQPAAVTGTTGTIALQAMWTKRPLQTVTAFTANPTFTYTWPPAPVYEYAVYDGVSGYQSTSCTIWVTINGVGATGPTFSISDSPPGQISAVNSGGSVQALFVTITSTLPGGTSGGPATDFGINVFLNDPNGGVNSPNVYRQLNTITDGTSNTILLGHAYVQTSEYQSTTPAPPSLQPIFIGGSLATGRNTLGDNATDWLQDGTAVTSNQWGSPMPEGGLMAMCDGTVRIFLLVPRR